MNRLFFESIVELLADLVELGWDVERTVRLGGVALVEVLMFGLGLVESLQRFHLGDDLVVVDALGLQFLDERFGLLLLGVIVREDGRPVLGADIRPLTVELGRIVNRKQDFQQVDVLDDALIVLDLDDLGVARVARTDPPIARIVGVAASVARRDFVDASQLFKWGFDTPETAAAKRCLRCGHTLCRDSAG